jgi:hypothetical protein
LQNGLPFRSEKRVRGVLGGNPAKAFVRRALEGPKPKGAPSVSAC